MEAAFQKSLKRQETQVYDPRMTAEVLTGEDRRGLRVSLIGLIESSA